MLVRLAKVRLVRPLRGLSYRVDVGVPDIEELVFADVTERLLREVEAEGLHVEAEVESLVVRSVSGQRRHGEKMFRTKKITSFKIHSSEQNRQNSRSRCLPKKKI